MRRRLFGETLRRVSASGDYTRLVVDREIRARLPRQSDLAKRRVRTSRAPDREQRRDARAPSREKDAPRPLLPEESSHRLGESHLRARSETRDRRGDGPVGKYLDDKPQMLRVGRRGDGVEALLPRSIREPDRGELAGTEGEIRGTIEDRLAKRRGESSYGADSRTHASSIGYAG